MKQISSKQRGVLSLWPWILGINVLFILATLVFPYVPDGFLKWSVLARFNLADEMNFAAWWSSYLMLICSIVAYQISNWDFDSKKAWTIIAIIFSFLSLDELGSLHERIGNLSIGFIAYLMIALIAGFSILIASWILWQQKEEHHGVILILIGIGLLVSAAPNEYIEQHVTFPYFLIGPRVAFEEGLEITGALVALIGIAKYQPVETLLDPINGVIPSLGPWKKLRNTLFAIFLFHIGLSWITVKYIEVGFRGNPATWYFAAVFGFLAFIFLTISMNVRRLARFSSCIWFGLFLIISSTSVYFVSPKSSSVLNNLGWMANPNALQVVLLIIIFFLYYFLVRKISPNAIISFLIAIFSLILGLYFEDPLVTYLVSGFFAMMVAVLFLSNSTHNESLNFTTIESG